MHHVPVDAQGGSACDLSPNRLLAAPRLAGIAAAEDLLTGAVPVVLSPVTPPAPVRAAQRAGVPGNCPRLGRGQVGALTPTEAPGGVRRGDVGVEVE